MEYKSTSDAFFACTAVTREVTNPILAKKRAEFMQWKDTNSPKKRESIRKISTKNNSIIPKKRNISEKNVQSAIMQYLTVKKIFHWRNNTGAVKTDHGFMRFGSVGSPDIFVIKDGKVYGIECKSSIGRQRPEQQQWQKEMEKAGGVYLLARSVEDVMQAIK